MAFIDMYSELTGCIPKLPVDYSKTLINRAWRDVRRQNLWSFQLFEANWTSPNIVNSGTATTIQGSSLVVLSAAAITAVNAIGFVPSPVTERQFRIGIGTIYNIWAWDGVDTLTLDRPYAEASGSAQAYAISQAYYIAPFEDFLTFMSVRDIVNFNDLVLNKNRDWIDMQDPQRTIFYIPTHVVYYTKVQNPNSSKYGWPSYELWGNPQYQLIYQLYGIRRGVPLSAASDTLPPEIGEDCVVALARKYAYEWAEANKGDMPRANGSDYRYLIGVAGSDYNRLYKEYRRDDRERVDNWFNIRRPTNAYPFSNVAGFYNSIGQMASPGAPW